MVESAFSVVSCFWAAWGAGLAAGVFHFWFLGLRRGWLGLRVLCSVWGCVGGGEEVLPLGLPGPVLGQVKLLTSGAVGDPGGDVDDFGADRSGPGLGELAGGVDVCGAGEVVGHHIIILNKRFRHISDNQKSK